MQDALTEDRHVFSACQRNAVEVEYTGPILRDAALSIGPADLGKLLWTTVSTTSTATPIGSPLPEGFLFSEATAIADNATLVNSPAEDQLP
jgi:hypothetical protein